MTEREKKIQNKAKYLIAKGYVRNIDFEELIIALRKCDDRQWQW